jgi:hypothetical protein
VREGLQKEGKEGSEEESDREKRAEEARLLTLVN